MNPTTPAIPEGFTLWEGGQRPLPAHIPVEVIWRNGTHRTVSAFEVAWMHDGEGNFNGDTDIIAYRVLSPRLEPGPIVANTFAPGGPAEQMVQDAKLIAEGLESLHQSAIKRESVGQSEAAGLADAYYQRPIVANPIDTLIQPAENCQLPLTGPYGKLADVLRRAFDQAAAGKGKERHANEGVAFEDQPMATINRQLGSVHGFVYQAHKKSLEAMRLPAGRDVAELLGAINYLAGAVIALESWAKKGLSEVEEFEQGRAKSDLMRRMAEAVARKEGGGSQ